MSTCCPDCQAMHRTPYERASYHALLAQELAAKARQHADRAARWNIVAFVLLAVAFVLLAVRAVTQ